MPETCCGHFLQDLRKSSLRQLAPPEDVPCFPGWLERQLIGAVLRYLIVLSLLAGTIVYVFGDQSPASTDVGSTLLRIFSVWVLSFRLVRCSSDSSVTVQSRFGTSMSFTCIVSVGTTPRICPAPTCF